MERALRKKGFKREDTVRDHIWYVLMINDQAEPRIRIHMSMGGHRENIRQENLKKMSLEMKMNDKNQFFAFIRCPLSLEEYLDHLRENNHI